MMDGKISNKAKYSKMQKQSGGYLGVYYKILSTFL